MSNRMKNPTKHRTNKHLAASDAKKFQQATHLGKYATARDIQARAVRLRDLPTAQSPNKRGAGNRRGRGWL